MTTTVQVPHMPGHKSIRDDGFVKVKQKPSKNAHVLIPASLERHPERFAKRELAEMPLVVRRSAQGNRCRVWVDTDGRWWRRGGSVRVQRWTGEGKAPSPDAPRCFVVTLYEGANEGDLEFLLAWADNARAGRRLNHAWDRLTADWADDATYQFAGSRAYADPFHHRDKTQLVFPCDEPACGASWHRQTDPHEADLIRHTGQVDYTIRVRKEQFPDPGEGWHVVVEDVEFYGNASDVAGLVSDLEWAREECRRANDKTTAP